MATKKPLKKSKPVKPKAGTSKADSIKRKNMFVDHYFALNRNGTAAAKAAGYSEKSAASIAYELLKDPYVKARIEVRSTVLTDYVELTAKEVIQSMARALRLDPRKMYDEHGNLLPVHLMPDEVALELEGVDVDTVIEYDGHGPARRRTGVETTTSKVKFSKKSTARDQAMRYFGLNAKDKGSFDPDDGQDAPPPTAVTIDFKDARRQPLKKGV